MADIDVTPSLPSGDDPIPAFNLPEQDETRDLVEPHLDGEEHSYSVELHFDAPIYRRGIVVGFERGDSEVIEFTSEADNYEDWKRDFYEATRGYIESQRVANDGESVTGSVNAG